MHKEHEEAMRWDFQDRVALSWKAMWPGVTDTETAEIDSRVREYDQRWTKGPHAEEWQFLHAAYSDWRESPDRMGKFDQDRRANPGVYAEAGLTELRSRSLDQARNIAHEERCAIQALRPPAQRLPIQRER